MLHRKLTRGKFRKAFHGVEPFMSARDQVTSKYLLHGKLITLQVTSLANQVFMKGEGYCPDPKNMLPVS